MNCFQNKLLYITAYDGLCLFDQPLDENPGGTFRSLVNRAVGKARQLFDISIHNATAEDHFEDFPNENRNVVYSLYYENDVSTWRDLLYWIAVSVCGFFWVDRNGGLRIFSYRNSYSWKEDPDWSINYDERIAGSSQIADFKTSYDGIRITDLILEEDAIYTYEGYNARLLDIGANPFYQNLSTAQKSEFRMDLGHVVVTDMIVRPFRVDMKSAPIFDLGDKIAFENGDWLPWEENSRAAMSVIHSWIFSKNTLTLQAYGARRETVYTRSGSGGGSSGGIAGKGKTTEYFSYKNRETITVGTLNTSVELGAIDFYAEQETIIEAIAQLNPEHTGSGDWSVEYSWELDGVSEFGAISTGNDNSQPQSIETLAHIKDILTPGIHTLKLKAKLQTQSNNAASTFEADKGVKIILKGQGLEHQSIWNGIISLSDDWEKIQPSVGLKSFTELVDIYFVDWWKMQFSDSVPKLQAAQKIKSITETFVLKLSSQEFDIEGEDGTVLTTEDGFVLQTE